MSSAQSPKANFAKTDPPVDARASSLLNEMVDNSSPAIAPATGEILIGIVVDKASNGMPIVKIMDDDFADSPPLLAQAICSLEVGRQCAVTLTGGSQPIPLVLGQLQSAVIGLGRAAEINVSEAEGKIEIQSDREISFRCGEATFRMTSAGLVELRGNRVVSHSTGLNRIRGASVKLN